MGSRLMGERSIGAGRRHGMIDAISFLILIALSIGLSHVMAPTGRLNRLFWTVAPGALLLFIVHPLALLFALTSYLLSSLVYAAGLAVSSTRLKARMPYGILLLLFIPDFTHLIVETPILWLGSAFFIIRQMMTVAQAIKNEAGRADFFPALLLSTFFFGALPSGPVFNGLQIWQQLKEERAADYGEGIYRLFEGFVFLFAIAGFASAAMPILKVQAADMFTESNFAGAVLMKFIGEPLAAFAFLFATFYGYSRMAEGSALSLGFEVPQNFNKPHLARDLGDFWKRWHRSMADFVMPYIYLPLLVTTSYTKLALIAAFVFMGLWHNLSPGFLIWGLGHGIALAVVLPLLKRRNFAPAFLRVASLAYVVFLSSIAHGVWSA